MASIDLRFGQGPGSANLLFGAGDTGPTPPVEATPVATLPALSFAAQAVPSFTFRLAATLPALTLRTTSTNCAICSTLGTTPGARCG